MVLPWAVRRVRPVASAAVVTAAAVLHLLAGPEFSLSLLMVPLTVYNLAANAPRSVSVAGLLLGLVGGVANGVKVWLFPAQFVTPDGLTVRSPAEPLAMVIMAIGCGLVVLTAWAFGDVVRNRRLAVRALEDRAHRLEVQSRQERELAAADERSHIAREMHDIVAHSLQVVISQADGARYAAAAKPALAVTALETIGQTGRSALADMRQLLGVLRETGETVAGVPGVTDDDARRPAAVVASPDGRGTRLPPGRRPQPRLADLPALVETMRLSGLEVSLLETDTPRRALPAGGELAAYRIVQEALTNTLRHGGPDADAFATLAWTARGLDLQIDDDGCGAAADPATRGSGQGLRGAAERAALFGGTLETGPRVGAGYRVSAHLPYSAV
ncbi:sensor histidine kinase [Micrococcus luteus]|uniref:sensor histidine kinase n=1 Tax=Micrococcus luteus TaxID=1270 RepID=UPI0035DED4B5